ncbi:MAG TPA: polysaccharide biosynthesis C-terminal domain-containing protein, partial [Devosia sp.]|nr:polysaccharide biosynthesis C-terminal domain-containing protein [Devosia sp.]
GSIATIALSVLLIPAMAEMGAALALAGGTLASLMACVIISERLTPVPVPWRDMAISLGIAAVSGIAAAMAAAGLGEAPALFALIAGGGAGGAAFLALNALAHPDETRALTMRLRNRLRSA